MSASGDRPRRYEQEKRTICPFSSSLDSSLTTRVDLLARRAMARRLDEVD